MKRPWFRRAVRTGAVGPTVVLLLLLVIQAIVQPNAFSRYGLTTILNGVTVVALSAAGLTLIVLVGGFDLSIGAAVSLVNVVIVTNIGPTPGSQALMIFVGLAVGAIIGLSNGLIITLLRIPSIVGTLAMSFFWGGIALLVLPQPGGTIPLEYVNWFTGVIGNAVPAAAFLLIAVGVIWLILKRTGFGLAIYAVGGDRDSADATGIRSRLVLIGAYTIGGLLYGLAGVFLSAQSASGDPNIGASLVLTSFAAVVIGGSVFGGGRGDLIGSMIGACVIYLIANILYALGVSSFYTNILNGVVLLIAVIAASISGITRFKIHRHRDSSNGGQTLTRTDSSATPAPDDSRTADA